MRVVKRTIVKQSDFDQAVYKCSLWYVDLFGISSKHFKQSYEHMALGFNMSIDEERRRAFYLALIHEGVEPVPDWWYWVLVKLGRVNPY